MSGRSFISPLAVAVFALLCVLVPRSLEPPETMDQPPINSADAPTDALEPPENTPIFLPPKPLSTAPQPQAIAALPPKPNPPLPRVAIIIDDMGYNRDTDLQLIDMELRLNFSFLPQAPHTTELAGLAHERGRTILVHLPMEPKDPRMKMEPLMLQVGEGGEILRKKTEKMLAAVPSAQGANNHMGSRFTQRSKEMRQVLSILKEHHLFFIDSYTTAGSVAEAIARQLHIPTARRRIFLDNETTETAICQQMAALEKLANADGCAIAIGHPSQAMIAALRNCAEQHLARLQLVGVEELVRPSL